MIFELSWDLLFLILLSVVAFLEGILIFFVFFTFLRTKKLLSKSAHFDTHNLNKVLSSEFKERLNKLFERIEVHFTSKEEELGLEALKVNRELVAFSQRQQEAIVSESQALIANSFARVQKELEVYKKNQLTKIDKQIRLIILDASRDVLGRSISFSEHEDMVQQALEKAKADQFFQ